MLIHHIYEFLCFYIINIIYEYSVYYIMCSCHQLKISRKKAYITAFFYANFLTLTNTLSNIIIAQKLVDETLPIIILTKLIFILGELLIILYLSRTFKKVWYQTYWLTILLHIILTIPMYFYLKGFTLLDLQERIIYQAVTIKTLYLYLASIGIMLISSLMIGYLVRLILKKIDLNKVSRKLWVMIYTCWVLIVLITEKTYQYDTDDLSTEILGYDNYREVIIAVMVIVFCIAVAIIRSDQRILRIENNLLKEQNEMQYDNFIAMQQKELEIHKLYHDIGNHINTIQVLVDEGETKEAKEYTRKLTQQYQGIKKDSYCNNKIINAVLLQKLRTCEESGIRYELEISLPQSIPIQDIDLMCIYSNLLDNAIESCYNNLAADNYIKIKTTQVGNYLGIKIINSKASNLSMFLDENGFQSTKKEKNLHGYGLRIIEEIVKRYDGYKEMQDNTSEFSAMVMLKLTPTMEKL